MASRSGRKRRKGTASHPASACACPCHLAVTSLPCVLTLPYPLRPLHCSPSIFKGQRIDLTLPIATNANNLDNTKVPITVSWGGLGNCSGNYLNTGRTAPASGCTGTTPCVFQCTPSSVSLTGATVTVFQGSKLLATKTIKVRRL